METYEVILEGNVRMTVKAYDFVNQGDWILFRDCYMNTLAIVNANRMVAIVPRFDKEDEDDEAEGTVE